MTTEKRWRCGIMGMADKVSGEDSSGQAQWRKCGTTGIDTVSEEMQDGNGRNVGQRDVKTGSKNGDELSKY